MSGGARRAADCSPGLWRIIKLAEESLRASPGGGQLGWLVIASLPELCPPRPFHPNGVTNFSLPTRDRKGFSFFPFHALLSFFLRSTSVSFAAERDANVGWMRPRRTLPGVSVPKTTGPTALFLHRLDINERTSRSYREKTLEVSNFGRGLPPSPSPITRAARRPSNVSRRHVISPALLIFRRCNNYTINNYIKYCVLYTKHFRFSQ